MAKTKSVNPAEAHRKSQRKKELAKHKETRKKARELANAKQDLGPIEEEIEELEAKEDPTGVDKNRLSHLRHELKRITKLKEDYLKDHPEHRALVYASTRRRQQQAEGGASGPDRKLFGKDGLPLRPERSIYYDPVMNPYGIPPPGMPYRERPSTPDPIQAAQEDEDSDEPDSGLEDIQLPPGPPPGGADSDSDDEAPSLPPDFIPPLPQGAIPPNAVLAPGFIPPMGGQMIPPPPPLLEGGIIPIAGAPGIPPPPFGFPQAPAGFPTPPPGFPALNMPHPSAFENLPPGAIPPPPLGFPNFPPNLHQQQPPPPLPRGFREVAGPGGHIDPLQIPGVSAAQPFQAYQQQQRRPGPTLPTNPSLPKRPPPPTSTKLALDENSAAATISAAPELRDFKKEATAFVPRGIRQKTQTKENPRVNAAPGDVADAEMEEDDARPNLMEALKKAGVTAKPPAPGGGKTTSEAGPSASAKDRNQEQQDEYDRFMDDIGDLLK